MVNRFILAATFCALAGSAYADEPRSVDYFVKHEAERKAIVGSGCDPMMVRTTAEIECYDARKSLDVVTMNKNNLQLERGKFNNVGSIYSPAHYDAFPFSRLMMLNECKKPPGPFHPNKLICEAAETSLRNAGGPHK